MVIFALFMLSLTGCVDVLDIEERWNVSGADERLLGDWQMVEQGVEDSDYHMTVALHEDGYLTVRSSREEENEQLSQGVLRTFAHGGVNFILLAQRDAVLSGFEDEEVDHLTVGAFMMYNFEGETVVFNQLQLSPIADAIRAGDIAGEIKEHQNSVVLATLDDATVAFLAEAFSDPENHGGEPLTFRPYDPGAEQN